MRPKFKFPCKLGFLDLLAIVEPSVGRHVDCPAGAQPLLDARQAQALLLRQRQGPGAVGEVLGRRGEETV